MSSVHDFTSRGCSRRSFLRKSSLFAAGAWTLPYWVPASVFAKGDRPGANDRINIGVIGMGRRGEQVARALPKSAQVVAISDVYAPRLAERCEKFNAKPYPKYQDLLQSKDVDAIITATNDQWRALVVIDACRAGKDVYAEKPLTLTVVEGRKMVEAARTYGRIVQTGGQQRSMKPNRLGCEFVRSGGIGKIQRVAAFNYASPWESDLPEQAVPEGLDWERWCGPAPLVPFNSDIFTPRANPGWISFRPYSGGEMTGWGAHGLDMVQWALGMDNSGPIAVWTEGDAFQPPRNAKPMSVKKGNARCESPKVFFEYPGGITVELTKECKWNGRSDTVPQGGAVFYGEKGTVIIGRNVFLSDPSHLAKEILGGYKSNHDETTDHLENWIECIRTRQLPANDVEIGHRTATVCHLGNIARWTGRKLQWHPNAESFVADDAANALLDRERRKGYELPSV